MMQVVTLADHSDLLPVSIQKQCSAFPPNFVHSLDATHMLMTANDCLYEIIFDKRFEIRNSNFIIFFNF